LGVTKFKVTKYKQKQPKRKTEKQTQKKKRKIIFMWLLCASFDPIELLVV